MFSIAVSDNMRDGWVVAKADVGARPVTVSGCEVPRGVLALGTQKHIVCLYLFAPAKTKQSGCSTPRHIAGH